MSARGKNRKMQLKDVTSANRAAWNEVTPIHQKARKEDLVEQFKRPGFTTFDDVLTRKLRNLKIIGKDIAQLCCNNGRETLSAKNMGARCAVGFDISDEAINEAERMSQLSGVECEFVRTDVYDIGAEHFDKYDILLITVGAVSWLPDLKKFFDICANMLRPGGHLVIYEMHPFTYLLACPEDEGYDPENPEKIVFSYFRNEPWVEYAGLDYIGGSKYDSLPSYSYTLKLSDYFNSIINSGMQIIELDEYPHDISNLFSDYDQQGLLPKSFTLVARK